MATKSELNALFQLAQDYHYAKHGKPHDMAEAMRLYREAAQQGHVEAQYELGAALKMPGEYQNTREAVQWLRKAAEQGTKKHKQNWDTVMSLA